MLYVLLALPQRPEYSLPLTYAPIKMKHLKGSKFQKMLNILRRITATYAMRYDARRRCPTCMLYTSWTPTTLLLFFPWLGSGVNSSAFWWRYAKLLGLVQHISPPISIWKERFHMIRVRTPVLQAVVYIRYPGLESLPLSPPDLTFNLTLSMVTTPGSGS
jgi:hypothetical protein